MLTSKLAKRKHAAHDRSGCPGAQPLPCRLIGCDVPWRSRLTCCLLLALTVFLGHTAGQVERPALTKEQMKTFLLQAKVVRSRQSDKGITRPWRLTLTDGTLTHDASFQDIDEHLAERRLDTTRRGELNFVDSYHYNIAAYALAELLALDSMMPMSVERRWQGTNGALTWWVDSVMMDEEERQQGSVRPPDMNVWNQQMYRMHAFSQLVYDTDRNLRNVLISRDWKLWMIDFTRAFRLWPDLQSTRNLNKCDRTLLGRLRTLQKADVEARTDGHLSPSEISALMTRRDKLVAHFDALIAKRGEAQVLY